MILDCVCMSLEVDHVTKMCTNMAGINSVTSRENDPLMESIQISPCGLVCDFRLKIGPF